MDFSRFTDPEAYKQSLAGLLRRGKEVGDYIQEAPTKVGQSILDAGQRQSALMNKAFDPTGNTLIRDPQSANQAAMNLFEGPMSFAPAGITAYHGTPHIFDKFDMAKVGTGEGHQVYGHGMYFAENPAVAKGYQKALSDSEVTLNNKPLQENIGKNYSPATNEFLDYADNNGINEAKDLLNIYLRSPTDKRYYGNPVVDNASAKELEDVKNVFEQIKIQNLGKLYKVDIPDQNIPMMLNYDRPIIDQPDIYNLIRNNITDPDLLKTFERNAESGISGGNVYANYIGGKTDAERSANALRMGIKGVKYYDQGSRHLANWEVGKSGDGWALKNNDLSPDQWKTFATKEEAKKALQDMPDTGTRNYVVFDPTDVKILERDNQPISRKELLQEQIDKLAQ